MKITPLFDRVLVTKIKKEHTTRSGIVLCDEDDREIASLGTVVAVGPGKNIDGKNVNMEIKVGQTILFEEHVTAKFIVEDTTYFLLRQIDILAIMGENEWKKE